MINLDLIVEALEMTNNETKFFFDREENDTVMLSPYSDDHSQISDMIDEDDDDRFIPLPNQREINEYGMMEEFVSNVRNDSQRAALEIAISGRGAFRRFKDTIIRLGLEKKWYAFRDKEYLRVAREWCEENKIEYEPTDADQPNHAASQLKNDTSDKEIIMRKLVALMKEPDNDDDDTSTDHVLAAMIRMIRVLNKYVNSEELDSILEDLEETLRGE